MKKFAVTLFLIVLVAGLVPALAAAQDSSKVEFAPYAVIMATKGPSHGQLDAEAAHELRMTVIDNLRTALKQGEIIIAGMVTDGSAEFIMIVETSDENAVRQQLKNAPNVKNGMYKLHAYSWYAPAGLKLETVPLVR